MKKIYVFLLTIYLCLKSSFVFAESGTWGQNIEKWLTREVGYLALGIAVVIMIPLLVKKAWAALAGTLLASGIALFFINNPKSLEKIGSLLSKIIFGSDVDV